MNHEDSSSERSSHRSDFISTVLKRVAASVSLADMKEKAEQHFWRICLFNHNKKSDKSDAKLRHRNDNSKCQK